MTREVTDNLYIELGYFTPEEYYVYEAEAETLLTSEATFVCVADGGAVKDFEVALSVSVTQTTQETRVRDFTAPLGTAFDTIMVIDALRITEVTLIVTAGVSAVPEVNRATGVTLSNIVTLNAQAIKTADTSAQLTGTFTQTSIGGQTLKFTASLNPAFIAKFSKYIGTTRPQQVDVTNGIVDTSDSPSKYSRNLRLGTNAYLRMQTSTDYHIKANENFIFECWHYVGSYAVNEAVVFGVGSGLTSNPASITASTHSWVVAAPSTSSFWQARFKNTSTTFTTINTSSRPTAGNWHHIAFRRINGNTVQLLINNSVVGSATYSGEIHRPVANSLSNLSVFYRGTTNTTLYIDEASYQIGASAVLGFTNEIANDPETHVLLQHFEANFDDDISFQAQAQAQLNTQATLNSILSGPVKFTAQLNSAFAQTTTANYTVDSDVVDIPFDFFLDADSTRIFPLSAQFDAVATQLTVAARVGEFLVSANSEFTQNTQAVSILDSTLVDIPFDFFLDTESTRTRSTPVSLAVEFTHSVDAAKTTDNVTAQSAEFTQAASIARIRDNEVQSQAEFTQTTLAAAVIDSDLVDIPFDFFQDVNADAIRDAVAEFDTIASQITIVAKTGEGITDLDSEFALAVTAEVTSGSVIVAQSEFTQSTEAVRIKSLEAGLSSEFSAAADAETVSVFTSTQTSEFTQSTDIARTRGFVSNQDTAFTQTAAVAKTTDNTVTMTTAFAQTADIDLVADSIILGPTSFNQNTQAVKTAQGQTTQTSEFTLTAQGDVGNIGEAQLNSTFTMTVDAAKTAQFIIFEPVVVSVTASGTVTRQGNVNANSESALTATPGKILQGSAELTAFYSQLTVGSEQSTGTALLSSQFVMTTVGKIIAIDPDLTYVIRSERREYQIPEEIREDIVVPESRTTIIRRA